MLGRRHEPSECHGIEMAVTVLVLQSFSIERCSPSSTADQEPLGSHIHSRPDRVANSLETEHGVIDVERNHVDPVRRVGVPAATKLLMEPHSVIPSSKI